MTLDANIQQRTEDVLAAVGSDFHPMDATAIVMQPRTGAILAMANWPAVNANQPGAGAVEAFQKRAVGGRVIHDDTEHATESLTTSQILAQSSNVGAIKIGQVEGPYRFNEWVHRFGFGTHTGIDLPSEETGATLPLKRYSGSSMGNLPIGQGELVTPIQMATAYSAIADGGILPVPHVVARIGGRPVSLSTGRRIISESTSAELRDMLKGVLAAGGTASDVSVPGYTLAGKTGTASKIDPKTGEYSKSAYVASFVGFAPASDPKLLSAVIVDEPQNLSIYGGVVAAPAFGQIMEFALPYLGISPH